MSKRILITDDEPDVRTYLTNLLEDNGYTVIIAQNGKEAYEMAKKEKPDLITLDISMPGESGVRALRDLQEDDETKNIPVIIVTGIDSSFKNFIHTRRQVSPPAGYFDKPIQRDEFLRKVGELLSVN